MLDLETLSTAPDAAIISIGATCFGAEIPPAIGGGYDFYLAVDATSAQRAGGRVDADTVMWWMKQSDAALGAFSAAASIEWALQQFTVWLSPWPKARIWGNGSDFDNVVLRSAYQRLGLRPPWEHRDNRCYRTLKNLRPDIAIAPVGTHHNALDDAVAQARHAEAILAAMKGA